MTSIAEVAAGSRSRKHFISSFILSNNKKSPFKQLQSTVTQQIGAEKLKPLPHPVRQRRFFRGSTPTYNFQSCNGDVRTEILAYAFPLRAGGCISSERSQEAFTVAPHSLLCPFRITSPDKRIFHVSLYHKIKTNQYLFRNCRRSSPTFQPLHT